MPYFTSSGSFSYEKTKPLVPDKSLIIFSIVFKYALSYSSIESILSYASFKINSGTFICYLCRDNAIYFESSIILV